jgi:predicted anti-sigma-YlaC factor YlaD
MRCDAAREALAHARYLGGPDPELQAHLAECPECRAAHAREGALDRALALDEPAAAGPGFDTRFFAKLAQEQARARKRRRLRFAWLLVPAAAAAAAALLWIGRTPPAPAQLPADELALAMDLELVEDIDVVSRLDELEAYELLGEVDEQELARLLAEEDAP